MTNAEPKQNKRQTKTEFETNTNVNEKCKTLGQNASPLFLPQWWMSATQVKSGRKSPTSKINQIAKMEVKFQCQISNVLLELRPPSQRKQPLIPILSW